MKVILSTKAVFPFHGYGGIEKYPYYLAKYLIKEGFDVKIVTSLDRGKKRVEIYDGIKYVFIPPLCYFRKLTGPWYYLYRLNLATYLRKEKFDILHGYSATPYIYLHFKKRVPTIVQPFGMESFTLPLTAKKYNMIRVYDELISRHPWRYCITHADAVASEGDFQVNQIMDLFNIKKEKIFDLPIGVDISFINEKLETREISRRNLGLNHDDFVLISVNRFTRNKAINYLIDAFRIIKQELKDAKLILIGGVNTKDDMTRYQRVMKQIEEYNLTDSIVCLKNVPEYLLYSYYALADVYVSPTLHDDTIMSILEAMACGLPMVSTGQKFHVKHGINGYVVPKKNARAIAEAVLKMYDKNECIDMGNKSREFINKEYNWEIIAKVAIREYEKLIE